MTNALYFLGEIRLPLAFTLVESLTGTFKNLGRIFFSYGKKTCPIRMSNCDKILHLLFANNIDQMHFDPNNNIVKFCAKGMELEGEGEPEEAHKFFMRAWEEATIILKNLLHITSPGIKRM